MDVLLWRHAEAEEGPDDFARPLTERGKKQAASVAAWLSQHLPRQLRVIAGLPRLGEPLALAVPA